MDKYSEIQVVSRSVVVREALRDYLFVQRFRALQRELCPLYPNPSIPICL